MTAHADDDHRAPFFELDRERIELEESNEAFDRVAFTMETLDRIPPRIGTIAVYESRPGKPIRIDEGRDWAIIAVSPRASRRAIVHAIAAIAKHPIPPWSVTVYR